MKFTPGPWYSNGAFVSAKVKTEGERQTTISEIIFHRKNGNKEDYANVSLITAAPDLYEACKLTMKMLETMTTENFSIGRDKPVRNAIQKAITKAEGK